MGLDAVELVMKVEEVFDIKVDERDVDHLQTVGDLYDYIVSKIKKVEVGNCLVTATFEKIEHGLKKCGINEQVGPATELVDVLPKSHRRKFWSQLQRSVGLTLPNLVRPTWVVNLSAILVVLLAGVIAFGVRGEALPEIVFPLVGLIGLVFFWWLFSRLTEPMATEFGLSFSSFLGLSERVLALNTKEISKENGSFGDKDIWIILRSIIVDTLSVDENEVTREANLIRDLGCN